MKDGGNTPLGISGELVGSKTREGEKENEGDVADTCPAACSTLRDDDEVGVILFFESESANEEGICSILSGEVLGNLDEESSTASTIASDDIKGGVDGET
jgi:hypothetical protein